MALDIESQKEIVKYRVEKAEKTLIEAKDCAACGHWTLAANRLYYALYYVGNALLVDKGMYVKTHAGMIVKINEHFVRTGILTREDGRTISILQNMRHSGDYDDCFEWEEEDVKPFFEKTRLLIDKIKGLLTCVRY